MNLKTKVVKHKKKITLKKSLLSGLAWSFLMIVFFQFVEPWLEHNQIEEVSKLGLSALKWILIGLFIGFIIFYLDKRKETNK